MNDNRNPAGIEEAAAAIFMATGTAMQPIVDGLKTNADLMAKTLALVSALQADMQTLRDRIAELERCIVVPSDAAKH